MSKYPNQLDDDVSLPRVDDNITDIGDIAINALRDAVFALEEEVGLGGSGTSGSIANRLGVSIDDAGNIKPSALTGIGLVTLPITNDQISPIALISESKLALDYPTATLYNIIHGFDTNLNTALNFISNHGSKLEPHLAGVTYRHIMNHIDVDSSSSGYFKNRYGLFRNNTNLYTLFTDFNKNFVAHEKADSTNFGTTDPTNTNIGTIPPDNFAHVAAGVFINPTNFAFIPQTINDVQQFAQFIDNSNIFILGTRIQNLYQNGVSRTSRSGLNTDSTHGQLIVPSTTVTTYHLAGGSSSPVDNIDNGDDLIEFFPSATVSATNTFDAQFSLVKIGDIVSVNYGTVVVDFIIKETKYVVNGPNKRYLVRINAKNILASTTATAQINKPLFNTDKYGVLALAEAQPITTINNSLPSLIVGAPRGAEVLGIGFNPYLLNSTHYNLYLTIYPTGNPVDGSYSLVPIDITGNQGKTPGKYTLDSIVTATNSTFRKAGYNYRFIAYSYQGNFGIMLADPYSKTSFSIASGIIGVDGFYDAGLTGTVYQNNVVDVINNIDPLGFGSAGANLASPPFQSTFSNTLIAQTPTKIFVPLTRKTFYVNGVERERLNIEPEQRLDANGDGYWLATIIDKQVIGARVKVTYQVTEDLSVSGLKIGKTIVVQSENGSGSQVDFGRFFIENVQFNNCNCDGYSAYTTIAVYDGIHGTGVSPYVSSSIGTTVRLYFCGDSVGFNIENANDIDTLSIYKRHFEVYVNQDGYTFSHERGRINISGSNQLVNGVTLYGATELNAINIYKISPKLRGYLYAGVRKINLHVNSFDASTGVLDGYLCAFDGSNASNIGPNVTGKQGEVIRFYDETNIDYVDLIINLNDTVPSSTGKNIDIQLFSTLSLDDEVMLLGTCQVDDTLKTISYLRDERQFGNVSEKQLSTSALDYISAGDNLLHQNGVIRGFTLEATIVAGRFNIAGGMALVNGKLIQINNTTVNVPYIRETYLSTQYNTINWALCVNNKSQLQFVPLLDYDSVNATPSNTSRTFTAFDPINSLTYAIEAETFSNIINVRKDLTMLYLVTSTVTTVMVATTKDIKKYAFESDRSITPTITTDKYQGNFYTQDSLKSWLDLNSNYNSNVKMKGNFTSFANYSYSNVVNFERDGYCFITPATSHTLSNVNFKNITFSLNVGNVLTLGNNCYFDGCTFIINSVAGLSITGKSEFKNCTFTVNSYNGILISSSNVKINDCTFTYNYNPVGDGTYSSSNLINNTRGMIYCVPVVYENIYIEGNTFNNSLADHYSFINVNFSGLSTSLTNCSISRNYFNVTNVGDDLRAVISFVGSNTTATTNEATAPRMTSCQITKNVCNKNQMIALTGVFQSLSVNNPIIPSNVEISKNVCGAIGFIIQSDRTRNFANISEIKDKRNELMICENNVKIIFTADHTGQYIGPGQLSSSNKKISNITISDNNASRINILVKALDALSSANVKIINNNLTAYDNAFFTSYTVSPYAIGVSSASTTSNQPDQVIITGNSISKSTALNSDLATYTDYFYSSSVIVTRVSATITNNVFRGMSAVDTIADIGGTNHLISHNFFYRDGYSIYAYIVPTGNSIIIDNIFDSPTTNGTDENIVDNSSVTTSIYERNKNQTSFKAIAWHPGSMGTTPSSLQSDPYTFSRRGALTASNTLTSPGALDLYYEIGSSGTSNTSLSYLRVFNQITGTNSTRAYADLSSELPENVSIISAKCGIVLFDGGVNYSAVVAGSNNNFTGKLTSTPTVVTDYDNVSPTNTILDPSYGYVNLTLQNFSSITWDTNGDYTGMYSTKFISIVPTGSDFITTKDHHIIASVKISTNLSTVGNDTGDNYGDTWLISPIVVKYRW